MATNKVATVATWAAITKQAEAAKSVAAGEPVIGRLGVRFRRDTETSVIHAMRVSYTLQQNGASGSGRNVARLAGVSETTVRSWFRGGALLALGLSENEVRETYSRGVIVGATVSDALKEPKHTVATVQAAIRRALADQAAKLDGNGPKAEKKGRKNTPNKKAASEKGPATITAKNGAVITATNVTDSVIAALTAALTPVRLEGMTREDRVRLADYLTATAATVAGEVLTA